jgi:hypothetical protein
MARSGKCLLEEICQIFSGFAFKSQDLGEHGIPVIKIANIQGKRVLPECVDHFPDELMTEKLRRFFLQDRDTLIAMTGAGSVGKVGRMIRVESRFLVNQRVAIVRPDITLCDPVFVNFVLSQNHYEKLLYGLGLGAGQPNVSANQIGALVIPFPPLPIQRRIGGILSAYDELAENSLRRIRILDEMAHFTRDLLLQRLLSETINFSDADSVISCSDEASDPAEPGSTAQSDSKSAVVSLPELPSLKKRMRSEKRPATQVDLGDEKSSPINQTDRSDVLAVIRQVFSDGQARNRQNAIREVARALGYGRIGHRISDVLYTDFLTASRRGVLENVGGELRLLVRSIADYDRDFLKLQFLASIGRSWIERDQAVQDFCRWMGFRRTGPIIDETARSLIQGLLRESRLEADGPKLIRRSP